MYLLNRGASGAEVFYSVKFTFHYVSIKSDLRTTSGIRLEQFTFHYVSIKSSAISAIGGGVDNLHSTMYLLNLWNDHAHYTANYIYIPLCIY